MTAAATPADTRMMGVVHDALRRDLQRATRVLSTPPYPIGDQRVAIGQHVQWMMRFLHAHHHGEDAGLWPLVRARNPRLAALLDTMEADHARVAPLVKACATAADAYGQGSSDEERVVFLAALGDLADALLPHLRREEDDVMPLVSVAVTADEWKAVDQEYYVKPKSLSELGFEGHWLLDGLDAERAQVVVHQVPAVPRFVLVHGFRRRYRRRATACWGPADGGTRTAYGPAPGLPARVARAGEVSVVVPAPIEAVWRVLADVTRIGEWSHECRGAEWLDGATAAVPGARFRGTNRAGRFTWSRVQEVVVAAEPHRFVWRGVPSRRYPDVTEWRIELSAVEGGTRITQSFEVVRAPAVLGRLYALAVPSHRGRATALGDDLRRLGEVAAADQAPAAQAPAEAGAAPVAAAAR